MGPLGISGSFYGGKASAVNKHSPPPPTRQDVLEPIFQPSLVMAFEAESFPGGNKAVA